MESLFKVGDKVRRKLYTSGKNWEDVCLEKNLHIYDVITIKSIGGYYNYDCLHFEEVNYGWSWKDFELVMD